MELFFESYQEAYDNAVDAIVKLREEAEAIKDRMETIISACEDIEGEL